MVALMPEKRGSWTFEDLMALPDSPLRYEILDGTLLMSPAPGLPHEFALDRLGRILDRALGDDYAHLGNIAVNLEPSYFIPDLTLVKVDDLPRDGHRLEPTIVQLVVEAVSLSSRSTDRLVKPPQYAAAGIPAFWRIETEGPLSLTAYGLRGRVYTELGTWAEDEVVSLDEPFVISFHLADLRLP